MRSLNMFAAKVKASLAHLGISLVVVLLTSFLVYGVWYPGGLAAMTGGTGIYRIIIVVEIVLGPLMSLIVFNPDKPKKELVLDYLFIGAMQLAALIYGLYVVALSRPVYLVFVKDRIEIVAATELEKQDLEEAPERFSKLSFMGPELICSESPADPTEKSDLLLSSLNGKDIQLFPKYYRQCNEDEVLNKSFKTKEFEKLTPNKIDDLPSGIRKNNFLWLPIVSRFETGTVIFQHDDVDKPVYTDLYPFKLE